MTTVRFALDVRLAGPLDQERLTLLRDRLDMRRRGRLGDAEDEIFGSRAVGEGDTAAELTLVRWPNERWQVTVTYRGAPPAPQVLAELETQIRTAAAEAGLRVEG
ncbi:MAG: hypothetical protein ACQSGP_05890 [Frankia sp.]